MFIVNMNADDMYVNQSNHQIKKYCEDDDYVIDL